MQDAFGELRSQLASHAPDFDAVWLLVADVEGRALDYVRGRTDGAYDRWLHVRDCIGLGLGSEARRIWCKNPVVLTIAIAMAHAEAKCVAPQGPKEASEAVEAIEAYYRGEITRAELLRAANAAYDAGSSYAASSYAAYAAAYAAHAAAYHTAHAAAYHAASYAAHAVFAEAIDRYIQEGEWWRDDLPNLTVGG